MFYATLTNDMPRTFRFYTKADRDLFVQEHDGAGATAISAKKAKYAPNTDRCATYSGKSAKGSWCRI